MQEFEFTLPISGKVVVWRPLKVQESLDLAAAYRSEANQHLRGPAMLIKRIVRHDGKEGAPSQTEWGAWDADDLQAFNEEVDAKESMRRAAFRKERGANAFADVMQAIDMAQQAAAQLGIALRNLAEANQAYENSKDPLASPKT